jgi:hypothetical protein
VHVTSLECAEVAGALDAAERAGLLVVESECCRAPTFTHDLVRQAVVSLMPTWSRIELHHAVGVALLADDGPSSWAEVAAQLERARPLVDDAAVANAAARAATEDFAAGAFNEAASHLSVALQFTGADGRADARSELLLQRGQALWAAERAEESRAALLESAALARRTGNSDLLARVALSWCGGEFRPIFKRTDHQFLALIREALTVVPADDSRLRSLLLSRLARCGYWDISDPDGSAACGEAVAIARRLGDPEALTDALGTRFYYCWTPELVGERLQIANEILELALTGTDSALVAQASYFRILALLESGALLEAWTEVERFEGAAAASAQPTLKLRALWFRATRHLAMGQVPRPTPWRSGHGISLSESDVLTPPWKAWVSRWSASSPRAGWLRRSRSSVAARATPSCTTRRSH